MRNWIFISIIVCCFSANAQLSPQSKKVTEKFFPDPDININTPAFQKKKGFTTYEELIQFLTNKVAKYPDLLTLTYIGNSQKGKQVPLLTIVKPNIETEKVKVWLQGGLHGNEPGSVEAMLYIIDQLLENKENHYLLDRLHLAILPLANVDGYMKQDRYAANGLDLNRDQTKLKIPESQFLKQTFSDFNADVAVDFHEYRPYRKDFATMSTYGICSLYDAMFLYSGNLNVPEDLRKYTEERFVDAARKKLDENNLYHHPYISTSKHLGEVHFNQGSENSRSSATSYALANSISTLIEVRGVGIGKTSYKRRVQTAFLIGMSYLNTAYEYADELKAKLQEAARSKHQASLKTKKEVYISKIKTIDLDKNELIDFEVTIRDALQLTLVKSRARPNAYLIMPEMVEVIERLMILGLKVDFLSEAKELEVERYQISQYQQEAEKYEGEHLQEVKTDVSLVNINFPKGTAIVKMDQERANLAMEVLEPEVKNSFVSFNVIETEQGAILPIYRYINETTIQP